MNEMITLQHETLDFVIFRFFSRVDQDLFNQTYELNPEISEYGVILPEGIPVKLPVAPASSEKTTLHLWD